MAKKTLKKEKKRKVYHFYARCTSSIMNHQQYHIIYNLPYCADPENGFIYFKLTLLRSL